MSALLIAFLFGLLAPPSQARETPGSDRPTTGVIAGVVVSDDQDARPLGRVAVTLAAGDLRAPLTTTTGDDGRFTFAAVRAGTYTLAATKPAYVPAFFGGKRPGRQPGVPIALLEGQRLDDLTIRMLRGGAITGTIRQPGGRPAGTVSVQVSEVATGSRRKSAIYTHDAVTDDRGVYRVFGLPPGEYVIEANAEGGGFGEMPARQTTAAHLRWAQQMIAGTGTAAGATGVSDPPPDGRMLAYASVYYPGTTDSALARVVRVEPAQEHAGIDFALELVPITRVTGVVLGPDGGPMEEAQLSVRRMGSDRAAIAQLFPASVGESRSGGGFVLDDLRPGRYTVVARAADASDQSRTKPERSANVFGLLLSGIFRSESGSKRSLWAQTEIVADGRDVSGLVLRLQAGMTVSGRMVFEGASARPAMSDVRVALGTIPDEPSMVDVAAAMLSGVSATVADAGTFEISGVAPDRYRATVVMPGLLMGQMIPGSVWALKSIDLNGRDVADLPLDVRPNENVSGLVVTITDQPTRLSGVVIDSAGRPAPGYPLLIFSTDRAYWLPGSRRVQQVRPSSDGTYEAVGLPAGEYYVSAVADVDQLEYPSVEMLEHLSTAAFRLRLAAGERKVQDVKLGGF